jgi:alpha-beta hydrolase superfamily lysophospholipase
MSYSKQQNWKAIQAFLPDDLQLHGERLPREESWNFDGHQIHLDAFRNPDAKVKVILFHGVGTNARQMTTILGAPLAQLGFECIAIDMPGYGATTVRPGALVTYGDWVRAGCALVRAEQARDSRPIVLYGLSAGGMLTYHVAATTRSVKGIVGMTFLDLRDRVVQDEATLHPLIARIGIPLMHLTAKIPLLRRIKIPMSLAGKMYALVNDKAAMKTFMRDRSSAGNWATMSFLSSYMAYEPVTEPEQFDVCPILLTQPAADRWTPLHLSDPLMKRAHRVPTEVVMLDNAGHYPLEEPGLTQMRDAVAGFARRCTRLDQVAAAPSRDRAA